MIIEVKQSAPDRHVWLLMSGILALAGMLALASDALTAGEVTLRCDSNTCHLRTDAAWPEEDTFDRLDLKEIVETTSVRGRRVPNFVLRSGQDFWGPGVWAGGGGEETFLRAARLQLLEKHAGTVTLSYSTRSERRTSMAVVGLVLLLALLAVLPPSDRLRFDAATQRFSHARCKGPFVLHTTTRPLSDFLDIAWREGDPIALHPLGQAPHWVVIRSADVAAARAFVAAVRAAQQGGPVAQAQARVDR
jgi:hypothetical protein